MSKKYNISYAAKILGLSCEMLRHYERHGIITPERTSNGYRNFSSRDINMITAVKSYQGMGFSIEEVEALMKSASLDNVQENLIRIEEKISKEIRWKQLVLDAVKRKQRDYEKLKCPRDKYIIKTNPSVYRIHTQYNELFFIKETILPHIDKWISLMPVVRVSPEFTIHSVYNNLDDYNFGFMVDASLAEELELLDTPGIKLIPEQTCLTTIISSEGTGHIKAGMLYDAVKYMAAHGMKMSGNAWGSTIGSFLEDNVQKRYHEIYIPIEINR